MSLAGNVAWIPVGARQIDPFEDHGQFRGADEHAILSRPGKAEGSLLQTLLPKGQAVAVPIKDFEAIAAAVAKDKEMSRERIAAELIANNLRQAVKAAAHVRGRNTKIDLN